MIQQPLHLQCPRCGAPMLDMTTQDDIDLNQRSFCYGLHEDGCTLPKDKKKTITIKTGQAYIWVDDELKEISNRIIRYEGDVPPVRQIVSKSNPMRITVDELIDLVSNLIRTEAKNRPTIMVDRCDWEQSEIEEPNYETQRMEYKPGLYSTLQIHLTFSKIIDAETVANRPGRIK
jgi:hypothetical protein